MNIHKLILIILTLELSGCSINQGFPKEINGQLKPINSQEVKSNVE